MPLYVLALTDTPLEPLTIGRRVVRGMRFGSVYAIHERRRVAPVLDDDALREQHALVVESARHVDAILPVRFGAFVDKTSLARLIRDHGAEIRQGLDEVRNCRQMTIRLIGIPPPVQATRASSGREYLEARRRAAAPDLPPAARTLLDGLRPLVVRERIAPGAGRLVATVYHLVDAGTLARYTRLLRRTCPPDALVSGPWPPFAFTPQLL